MADSEFMYHNDSKSLETKYGYDGREAAEKALEPAYNYYGVEIKKVSENKRNYSAPLYLSNTNRGTEYP